MAEINLNTTYAYAELHEKKTKMVAAEFFRHLISQIPYQIHTILTDNGIQFTNRKKDTHAFDRVCYESGIEHCLTKVNHPWANGQVAPMKLTLKEAIIKHYPCTSHQQLKEHLRHS